MQKTDLDNFDVESHFFDELLLVEGLEVGLEHVAVHLLILLFLQLEHEKVVRLFIDKKRIFYM